MGERLGLIDARALQVVRFANGHRCTVGKERWTIAAGGRVIATRSQVAGMSWHARFVFSRMRIEQTCEDVNFTAVGCDQLQASTC